MIYVKIYTSENEDFKFSFIKIESLDYEFQKIIFSYPEIIERIFYSGRNACMKIKLNNKIKYLYNEFK